MAAKRPGLVSRNKVIFHLDNTRPRAPQDARKIKKKRDYANCVGWFYRVHLSRASRHFSSGRKKFEANDYLGNNNGKCFDEESKISRLKEKFASELGTGVRKRSIRCRENKVSRSLGDIDVDTCAKI